MASLDPKDPILRPCTVTRAQVVRERGRLLAGSEGVGAQAGSGSESHRMMGSIGGRLMAGAGGGQVGLEAHMDGAGMTSVVLEALADAIVLVDGAGQIRLANAATESMFGYSRGELVGQPVEVLLPDHYRDSHAGHHTGFFSSPHARPMGADLELWGARKDGVEFPVDISISPLETADGRLAIAAIRDISSRRLFEEDLRAAPGDGSGDERLRVVGGELVQALDEQKAIRQELDRMHKDTAETLTLLETLEATAPVGFGFIDRDFRIQRMNATLAAVNGRPREEQLGSKVSEVVPDIWPFLEPIYAHVLDSGEPVINQPVHGAAPSSDGRIRHWLGSYYPVRVDETIIGIGLVVINITERQEAEEFNSVVMDNMAEGLYVTDEHGRLVFMNEAASRMTGWSEDELRGRSVHDAIHYQHADGSTFPMEADTLVKASASGQTVREPDDTFIRKDGSCFSVSYSSAPLHSGAIVRGSVVVFHDATEEKAEQTRVQRELNTLSWVGRIQDALDDDRLVLYSQPIVPLVTTATESKELLLHMVGRDGEIIAPGSFLPTAEKYGQITDIDRWVIRQAMQVAASGHHLHLNLSANSITNIEVLAHIKRELTESGTDPANIVVEITETALMGDMQAGIVFARGIKDLGCAVALDDFGTGYGSFTYLQKIPLDFLKIDVEFVRDLSSNKANQHLIKATVNIAQGFDLQTIAEGVEDAQTLSLLREYGVDLAQGFHLGRPEPIPQLTPSTRDICTGR